MGLWVSYIFYKEKAGRKYVCERARALRGTLFVHIITLAWNYTVADKECQAHAQAIVIGPRDFNCMWRWNHMLILWDIANCGL